MATAEAEHAGTMGSRRLWRKLRLAFGVSSKFRYVDDPHLENHEQYVVSDIVGVELGEISDFTSYSSLPSGQGILADDVSEIPTSVNPLRVAAHVLKGVRRLKATLPRFQNVATRTDFAIGVKDLRRLNRESISEVVQGLGGMLGLLKLLKTDVAHGLEDDDAAIEERRAVFGSNKISLEKPSAAKALWDAGHQATFIFFVVLGVTVVIMLLSTAPRYSFKLVLSVVLLVVGLTAGFLLSWSIHYYKYLQFFRVIEDREDFHAKVIRHGSPCTLSACEIVVGDIVSLGVCDQVPADGVLVAGQSLSVDEARVTGERALTVQTGSGAEQIFLLSGCKIVNGHGTMLVTAVGVNTKWTQLLSTQPKGYGEESPLEAQSQRVEKFLTGATLLAGVVTFVILLMIFFAEDFKENKSVSRVVKVIIHRTLLAISVGLLGLPVPASVVIIAAGFVIVILMRVHIHFIKSSTLKPELRQKPGTREFGMSRIAWPWIFVLALVIALPFEGSAFALTVSLFAAWSSWRKTMENVAFLSSKSYHVIGCATAVCMLISNRMTVMRSWVAGKSIKPGPDSLRNIAKGPYETLLCGICLNHGGSTHVIPQDDSRIAGELNTPTESPALAWGLQNGMDYHEIKNSTSVLCKEAFDSVSKRAGIVLKRADGRLEAHWTGDAEVILEGSKSWVDENGAVLPMSRKKLRELRDYVGEMAAQSLRCVAFAYRSLEEAPTKKNEQGDLEVPNEDLTFLCTIGIKEPRWPGLKETTAKFRWMDQYSKAKLLNYFMTEGFTNDAHILSEADVGIYMGEFTTEVAAKNFDVVIVNDDVTSIVKLIERGRLVYGNAQNVIKFQVPAFLGALILACVGVISPDNGWSTVQEVWVVFIMNAMGTLALETETPTDNLLDEELFRREEPIISNVMWTTIIMQFLYQTAALMTIILKGNKIFKLEGEHDSGLRKNTIVFNAFVTCQLFSQLVNARRPRKKSALVQWPKSGIFWVVMAVEAVSQLLLVQWLGNFAKTKALTWQQWLACVGIASPVWLIGFLGNFFFSRKMGCINISGRWLNRRRQHRYEDIDELP